MDHLFGITSGTGVNRSSGSLVSVGLGGVYDAEHFPAFSIINNGVSVSDILISWAWKEFES